MPSRNEHEVPSADIPSISQTDNTEVSSKLIFTYDLILGSLMQLKTLMLVAIHYM